MGEPAAGAAKVVGKLVMSVHINLENALLRSVMAAVPSVPSIVSSKDHIQGDVNWSLAGFGVRARVGTTFGNLPIEALRVRDEVRSASGKTVRVQWIDKLHLDEDFLTKHPSADPVLIPANAFGCGRPMQDMLVSPQQVMSPDAHVATRFKTAHELCSQARAQRVKTTGLTYYRFHCGEPVVVRVEGVWVGIPGQTSECHFS